MEIEQLAGNVERALASAHARVRDALLAEPYGLINSYLGQPGLWETAEAIGIIGWKEEDQALLVAAIQAVLSAQGKDGGFPPWPDITSKESYCESTTRVLLSLAPVCGHAAKTAELAESVTEATSWLLDNQSEEGGWGSRREIEARFFPTTFSIQALTAVSRQLDDPMRERCEEAIEAAVDWIKGHQNRDGGFGTKPRARSNTASSGHAAWALTVAGIDLPESLRAFIVKRLDGRVRGSITDKIGVPPDDDSTGRFEVVILAQPMALVGAIAARASIYEPRVVRLVRTMLAHQAGGVWLSDSGRFVWPTYMHVTALRLWLAVHRAHAQISTSDFSELGTGAILPERQPDGSLYKFSVPPPPDSKERLAKLSPKQRVAFVAWLKGETMRVTAQRQGRSEKTIQKHRYEALRRLGIGKGDNLEAMAIAVAGGLIGESDEDPAIAKTTRK